MDINRAGAPAAWIIGGGVIIGGAIGAGIAWLWSNVIGNDPSPIIFAPKPASIEPQKMVKSESQGEQPKNDGKSTRGREGQKFTPKGKQ